IRRWADQKRRPCRHRLCRPQSRAISTGVRLNRCDLGLGPSLADGGTQQAQLIEERRYHPRVARLANHGTDAIDPAGLLSPRRERPRRRCAAEKCDEVAPFHSITSSVRASKEIGGSRPSAFAVLRLMTSSNLVACWTGRSPGLSPLRMRSTY